MHIHIYIYCEYDTCVSGSKRARKESKYMKIQETKVCVDDRCDVWIGSKGTCKKINLEIA